jgi:Na+/alanine symporter
MLELVCRRRFPVVVTITAIRIAIEVTTNIRYYLCIENIIRYLSSNTKIKRKLHDFHIVSFKLFFIICILICSIVKYYKKRI